MKQVHPNYSFVAATKTITLTGLNIPQDQLLLITNATRGVIYYNFASSSHRASVTAGANTAVVLTDASTTGHADNDQLIIHYEDQLATQTIEGTVTASVESGSLVNAFQGYADSYASQFPVGIDQTGFGNVPISGTVTANLVGYDGGNQENFRIGGYSVGGGDAARLALEVVGVDGNPVSVVHSGGVIVNSISNPISTNTEYLDVPNDERYQKSLLYKDKDDGSGEVVSITGSDPLPVTVGNPIRLTHIPNSQLQETTADFIKVQGFPNEYNIFNGIYVRRNITPPWSSGIGGPLIVYRHLSGGGIGGEFVPSLHYYAENQGNWPPQNADPTIRSWRFLAEEEMARKTFPVSNWAANENLLSYIGAISPIGVTGFAQSNGFYPGDYSNITISPYEPTITRDPTLGCQWEFMAQDDIPMNQGQAPTVLGLLQRICYRFTQNFGFPNSSAASSDTESASNFFGFFKRLLQRITTLFGSTALAVGRVSGTGATTNRLMVGKTDSPGANWRTIQITAGPRYSGTFVSQASGAQGWIETGDGFYYNILANDNSDGWDVWLRYGAVTGVFSGSRWHLYDNARSTAVLWCNTNTGHLPLAIASGLTRNTSFIAASEPVSITPVEVQPVVIQSQRFPINVNDSSIRGSSSVFIPLAFTANSSTPMVGSNYLRKLFTVYNEGPGNLYVLYGEQAVSLSNYHVRLAPRDYLEVDKYTGQINGFFDLANSAARISSIQ